MADCLFCKIANKEIFSYIVYENEKVLCFLDILPLARGHLLVIPKNHAENILHLKEEDLTAVFKAAKTMTKKLFKALKPDGFTIGINHGKISGQTIDHFHLHIIPRFKGDGGGSIRSVIKSSLAKNFLTEELESVRVKIIKVK